MRMSADDIRSRTQLLDNEIRIMRSEVQRINHSSQTLKEKIKENNERIKVCRVATCFFRITSTTLSSLDKQDTPLPRL